MEWMIKRHSHEKLEKGEVLVTTVTKNKAPSTSIRFGRNSWMKVSNSEYVCFAVEGSRLYFREADKVEGWKLSGKNNTRFFKVFQTILPITEIEEGEYNLEFDRQLGLFYVDSQHKLGKLNFKMKGER